MLKFKKDVKLTDNKLLNCPLWKVVFLFSTATKKHEKHSEAIGFMVDKSSVKEIKRKKKENNTIFLRK